MHESTQHGEKGLIGSYNVKRGLVAQVADQGQQLIAGQLYAGGIHHLGPVLGGVQLWETCRSGKVCSGHVHLLKGHQVCVASREEVIGQRNKGRPLRRAGQRLDPRTVARAGSQKPRRRIRDGVQIEDKLDLIKPGMLSDKGMRADGARLLPICEEEHHVLTQRRACMQCSQDLQKRDDARSVVCRSRDGRGGVIVGHQQDGAVGITPREADENVLHRTRYRPAACHHADTKGVLHLRLQA